MDGPCQGITKGGTRCRGIAGPSGYCFSHDPALAERRRAGSSRGGKGKKTETRAAKLLPEVLKPVLTLVLTSMVKVDRDLMDPRKATAIAALARAAVAVYQAGLLEEKVRELEELALSSSSARRGA